MPIIEPERANEASSQTVATPPAITLGQTQLPLPSAVRDSPLNPDKVSQWNTTNIGKRLAADLTSAASAAGLVAPVICVLDRPFLLIFGLYSCTYIAANTVDTLMSTLYSKPASSVSSGATKFLATSSVNMSGSIYKDSNFARMFGAKSVGPAAVVPKLSYALFAMRDSMTIFASFNLPSIIAPQLAHLPPAVKSRFSRILSTESGRANTAQFLAPAGIQLLSTPLHLLGLDLYNRQGRMGLVDRIPRILRDWGVSSLARMGRIIPAFGVGGVVNANVRKRLMTQIEAA
ncbi:hypothetical protein LTR10_019812 [Elasticomyces elasticus]|uniref:Sequence orphan n=1 Tax=Exophiala sideris TaxID=1016849 RepID=A0ABR0J378_9EURO|nr:hypothetical protein LTR10_019812 [Elasticomyces elasticus]KAK5024396.1 hypothetical protein LTS07_008687 [Exophiala sideris]KAK5030922.1 hypothetical protein LTR13_007935 [Exophiala sideris]KAK5054129.1 hypothetical protein LTR69_009091 [Exophiala sideris]KAK5179515.1 hypothetical protein LTR44_008031 [Eurotiomycetes sp. CCFEE 6388]